ncbi:MAG: zinc-ribbon domain containing protein [Chloroflexota bacterium]
MYSDKNLTCADCGQEFVFTASEQDFYAQRGFTEPRRCASCRASRKAARNAESGGDSSYGGYGAGGGYSAGGSSYGGSGGYGSRDRGPREMFTATCSNCGRDAEVPFRPTSGKPVYCSDCFRSMRGARSDLSVRAGPRPAEPALTNDPGRQPTGVERFRDGHVGRSPGRPIRALLLPPLAHAPWGALGPLLGRAFGLAVLRADSQLSSLILSCPGSAFRRANRSRTCAHGRGAGDRCCRHGPSR